MNNKQGISLLALVSMIAVLISAALIATSHEEASASVFATCENNCPDGGKVRCSGEDVATINDPADPGCICDEKEYRCSDRKKKPADKEKSKEKSAPVFATCENNCPDGGEVSCSGEDVATINDPTDPGCICDEKEYRCSDRKKKREDEEKSEDEKSKKKVKAKNKKKSEDKKSQKKEYPKKKCEEKSKDKNEEKNQPSKKGVYEKKSKTVRKNKCINKEKKKDGKNNKD